MTTSIEWVGKPCRTRKTFKYYKSILIDGEKYSINDTVCLLNEEDPKNPFLGKIIQLFSNSNDTTGDFFMRNKWYYRYSDVTNPLHVLPKKRNMLNINKNMIKKYEIFESCRYKNVNDLDVNDCETIDGKCKVMTMEQFAMAAKVTSSDNESEGETRTNIEATSPVYSNYEQADEHDSEEMEEEEEENDSMIPQYTFFCNYLYNPANGIFRPKMIKKRKTQIDRKHGRSANNSDQKQLEGRPESPWDRPKVRVGNEYQIEHAELPKADTSNNLNEWLKSYELNNRRLQHDDTTSQVFNAAIANFKNSNVESFLNRAKELPYINFDECFFLQILHECEYDENEALTIIKRHKGLGSKRRRYLSKYHALNNNNNYRVQSSNIFKNAIPKNFMSCDWAYGVVERFGARLVPYPKEGKLPKNNDNTTLCSTPTNAKNSNNSTSSRGEKNANGDDDNSDVCVICNSSGMLLCCDGEGCGSSFHLRCLGLKKAPNEDKWLCIPCRQNEKYKKHEANVIDDNNKRMRTPSSKISMLTSKSIEIEHFNPIHLSSLRREQKVPSPIQAVCVKNDDQLSLSPKNAMVIKSDRAMKLKKRILLS